MEQIEALKQDLENAELVLIGIGNEMQVKLRKLKEIERFREKYFIIEKTDEKKWLFPFLIRYYLNEKYHPEIVEAYRKLNTLIRDKNYFIVSLSTDDLIKKTDLKADHVALPCGTYDLLQCEENCQGKLYPIESETWEKVCGWIEDRIPLEELKEPKCPDCGMPLVMNQYGQEKYNESGYLENWTRYTKWLQGTVNRNLCIIELGVGMEFPSVVRWPFEKMCFYNQKSVFWRIHSNLYQLSGEIKERGISVRESPIAFLNKDYNFSRKDAEK